MTTLAGFGNGLMGHRISFLTKNISFWLKFRCKKVKLWYMKNKLNQLIEYRTKQRTK